MTFPKTFKIPLALFLVAYFIYLVAAKAPAAWAVWMATQAVPGLWMSAPQGSVWQGSASAAQIQVADQAPLPLGKVKWRLSPWSLLTLKPCLDLSTNLPRQSISAVICRGMGGESKISDLSLDAPVAMIRDYLPIQMDGDISIQIAEARIGANGEINSLDARYSWQRGRAYFEGNWFVLGSFGGTVKENGSGGALGELFDLAGPYKVRLNGQLQDYKQGWVFDGVVTPRENASELIVEGLKILGEDLGDGGYRVQWP